MAKKRKTRRRKRSQLGYNADASHAIKLARKGQCKLAMQHLVDAGGHNYPKADQQDEAHLARVIVNQHCGKARSRRITPKGGKAQQFPFWGRKRTHKRKHKKGR